MKIKKSDFKLLGIALIFLAIISVIIYLIVNSDKTKVYSFDQETIKKENYAANEVIPIYVDEEELIKNYYTEFINLLMNNREEAYKLIETNIKKDDYPTLEKFNLRIDEMTLNGLFESKVKEYRKSTDGEKNIYYITDTNGNIITIIEKSIMDYDVIV